MRSRMSVPKEGGMLMRNFSNRRARRLLSSSVRRMQAPLFFSASAKSVCGVESWSSSEGRMCNT